MAPPGDLLSGRKLAGPLALEENNGFGEGISVILTGFDACPVAEECETEEEEYYRVFGVKCHYT